MSLAQGVPFSFFFFKYFLSFILFGAEQLIYVNTWIFLVFGILGFYLFLFLFSCGDTDPFLEKHRHSSLTSKRAHWINQLITMLGRQGSSLFP